MKLYYVKLLSRFAFNFNLRRYTMAPVAVPAAAAVAAVMGQAGMGQDRIDDESEGLKMDSRSRAALMARLAGQDAAGLMAGAYTRSHFRAT